VDKKFVDLRNQEQYKDDGYNGDMIKSLEECIELGEKIIADEYICYPEIVEDWFSKHDFNEKMPEDIRKLFMDACREAEVRRSKDNEKFFDIMKKHHYGWWS
jgi:hypothetical protein